MRAKDNPLSRRLMVFCQLPHNQKGQFLLCIVAFPLLVGCLRLLSLRHCYALLRACAPQPAALSTADTPSETERQLAITVELAARHGLVRPTCLPRSLLLWWLLRWRRIPAELCIGGRMADGIFTSHAWVESAGHVLNDTADVPQRYPRFKPLLEPVEGRR